MEPLPAKRRGAAKKARAECGQWDSEKKNRKNAELTDLININQPGKMAVKQC